MLESRCRKSMMIDSWPRLVARPTSASASAPVKVALVGLLIGIVRELPPSRYGAMHLGMNVKYTSIYYFEFIELNLLSLSSPLCIQQLGTTSMSSVGMSYHGIHDAARTVTKDV